LEEAKELIINSGKASASFLQRRLSIGYARAARLLDILEENGIIGPSNGAKPREIMVSPEQYEDLINQGVSGVNLHNKEQAEEPDEYLEEEEDVETQDFASVGTKNFLSKENDKETTDDTPEEDGGEETPDDSSKKDKKNNPLPDDEDDGMYFAK